MKCRLTAILGAALIFTSSTWAQAPDPEPIGPPTMVAGDPPPPIVPVAERSAPNGRGMPMWVNADYLFAFIRGSAIPPFVTTSPAGTAQINAGVLGTQGTQTLFGDSRADGGVRAGFHLGVGCWFNPEQSLGLEAGMTILEAQSAVFAASSDAFPILGRPYVSAIDSSKQAVLIAFPGVSTGSIDVRASSANFYEAHLDFTEMALDGDRFRLVSLIGYRFYRYDEGIRIRQTVLPTGGAFVPGTQVVSIDDFSTRNQFHGVDLGFRAQFQWQQFGLDLLGKVAVGGMSQQVTVDGSQTTTVPGAAPVTNSGGVLALGSNMGTFSSSNIKFIPEAGATLGWQVRPNLNLRLGYTFLLMQGITRASDQIDLKVNPSLFPPPNLVGPARPAFTLNRTDVWIQSINLGLEFVY